jgi:hypothetical protein
MRRARLTLSRAVSLVLAVMLVVPVFAPMPASAASTFAGGPDQDPTIYVLNDHTAYAVHFTATGLTPGGVYHIKTRFTLSTSPSGQTNRGYTWNPSTSKWVQEREPLWSSFPTTTADSNGTITGNAGWVWTKFGDERLSGPYYIMISLNESSGSQTGTTWNCDTPTAVTVLDASSQGAWFHNGTATGIKAATRAEVTAFDATTTVYSLSKTETNTVDDDANGTVDDEDYGPAGKTGDWRLGVPAEVSADVFLNRQKKFDDISTPAADTEISIGAADMVAPSAPTALTAAPGGDRVVLDWEDATDDNAVESYRIYRWNEASKTTYSTPVHELVGTTSAGDTAFEDVSATTGWAEWSYEVRAVDTSGNVSARSNTATGRADSQAPTVTSLVAPQIASTASASRTFPVTWSAVDPMPGSGVSIYNLMVSSKPGGLPTIYTTAATRKWVVGNIGATYYFRTRASDAAGNWGEWSDIRSATVPYNETSGRFSGAWGSLRSSSYWLTSLRTTRARGASSSFTFRGGTSVGLVLTKGPGRGRAAIYVDGRYVKTIDTWASSGKARSYFAAKSLTGSGLHTIRVVNLATPGRPRLDLDGFAVAR